MSPHASPITWLEPSCTDAGRGARLLGCEPQDRRSDNMPFALDALDGPDERRARLGRRNSC